MSTEEGGFFKTMHQSMNEFIENNLEIYFIPILCSHKLTHPTVCDFLVYLVLQDDVP